jgi:hypothetical protein
VVSPITCVSMNHQNELEQMANEAMFTKGGTITTYNLPTNSPCIVTDPPKFDPVWICLC